MDDTRNRILKATCKAVRQYGLDGVRIQNISELAGLSPGALYRYFDSKETLLEACFFEVDKRVAELFERMDIDWEMIMEDPVNSIRALWLSYFRFWIARPDETIFYSSFRNTPNFHIFDRERDISHFQALDNTLKKTKDIFPGLRKVNQKILCIHILSVTAMYARFVVEGILPDNEQTENDIFHLLFTGMASLFRRE